MGCATPEGATGSQHRPPDRADGRLPDHHLGRHHQPLLLVGPADDRHGGAAHHRGEADIFVAGGVESISLRAERSQHAHGAGPGAAGEEAGDLLEHAADGREVAKRYGIGARRGPVRRRSQQRAARRAAGKFNHEIVPITTTMAVVDKATGALGHQGGHADRRRGHPRRHDLRRRRGSSPAIPGRRDRGRQRQPVLRRRLGLRGDGAKLAEKRG
jgi:acetyl-CoA C-acetyltransferase